MKRLSPQQKELLCVDYLLGDTPVRELAMQYGIGHRTVYEILRRLNIPRNRHPKYYTGNPFCFHEINTEQKAYWLGFITADGCVITRKRILTISLHRQDREHLELFRKFICTSHPVLDFDGDRSVSAITIRCQAVIDGLGKHGISDGKTHNLKWPDNTVPQEFLHHFIRGYNDGDGGFYVTPNKYHKTSNICFQVTSYQPFLLSLQNRLMKMCSLRRTKLSYRRKGIKSPTLRYCGRRQVKRIFDYLYKDATIWLPRKRDKIEPHL